MELVHREAAVRPEPEESLKSKGHREKTEEIGQKERRCGRVGALNFGRKSCAEVSQKLAGTWASRIPEMVLSFAG